MHQWSYLKSTIMGEDQIGPITEAEFVLAVKSGDIKLKTKVHCPTRTKGQWVYAERVPVVVSEIEKHQQEVLQVKRQESLRVAELKKVNDEKKRLKAAKKREESEKEYMAHRESAVKEKYEMTKRFAYDATHSNGAAVVFIVVGVIGFLVSILILAGSASVMHGILAVLVCATSFIAILGGAICDLLGKINRKLGAANYLRDLNREDL